MIRLIKPYIEFNDIEKEFREIFQSGVFTRGEYSKKLPEEISNYTGAKYTFNTSSATTALSTCLAILEIKRGDEVVISDFSFPATVNVVENIGATPVFADVSLETYNMLSEELENKITPRTKAVIFVCAFGNPDGIEMIEKISNDKKIPLIVDAACGIGSSINGRKIGNIGDFSCFSFHPRKLLTSGEGGSITTNNDEYAKKLAVKLLHGSEVIDGKMVFSTYGYNYRLPELQCIMLIKQLDQLDDIVKRRKKQWEEYKEALIPLGFKPQYFSEDVIHNFQSVVFLVPKNIDRDDLIAKLKGQNIESTIGTYCQSACEYYKNKYNDVQQNSYFLETHTITLPCHDEVDVRIVIDGIMKSL